MSSDLLSVDFQQEQEGFELHQRLVGNRKFSPNAATVCFPLTKNLLDNLCLRIIGGMARVYASFNLLGHWHIVCAGKQVINSLKRPVNSFSRESSTAANFSIREPVEREGTTMLSSTSWRRDEEQRSASLGGIEGKIQNLSVGKACPVSFDDDCIYIEHEVIQQKNRLGNNRPGSVINLDDQFAVVMEQQGLAAVQSEASPQTGKGFSKCSEEVKNVLDEKRFRLVT